MVKNTIPKKSRYISFPKFLMFINNGSHAQMEANNVSLLYRNIWFELKEICINNGSLLPRHIPVKMR